MPPEFRLFLIGGEEMLLHLIGHREGFAFVFVRVTATQQEVHRTQRTQNRLSKWR